METEIRTIKVVKEWHINGVFIKILLAIAFFNALLFAGMLSENCDLKRDLKFTQTEVDVLTSEKEQLEYEAVQALCLLNQAQEEPTVVYAPFAITTNEPLWTEEDVMIVAQVLWGEYRGYSKLQQSGVVWCILNRVDSDIYPDTISEVATAYMQFTGYSPNNPVDEELVKMVEDVFHRWELEKTAVGSVGRTLPKDYLFFVGNGKVNLFSKDFHSTEYWDWSLENPYIDKEN